MKTPKAKHILIYTLLGFAPLSVSFFFTPIYTHYLSKEAYGMLNIFGYVSGLLIPFMGLGVDYSFGYLYWEYREDKDKLQKLLNTTICFVLLFGVFLFFLGLLIGPWIASIALKNGDKFVLWPYIALSLIYPVFVIISRVLLNFYRNEGDIKKYSIFSILLLILVTAGSFLGIITFNRSVVGAIEGRTVGFCLVVFCFAVIQLGKFYKNIGLEYLKPLLKMGIPLFLSAILGTVAYTTDRMVIERFNSLEVLGVYGFAFTIASVVEIFMGGLTNSLTPKIYHIVHTEEKKQYEDANSIMFTYVYGVLALIVLIIASIHPFLTFLISDDFKDAAQYVPVLCVGYLPRCFAAFYSMEFYKSQKTTYVLMLNVLYLISAAGLSLLFNVFWGGVGVAIAVFFAGLLNLLGTYYFSSKLSNFSYKLNKSYLFCLIIIVSIVVMYFLPVNGILNYITFMVPLFIFVIFSFTLFKNEISKMITYFRSGQKAEVLS